MNILEDAKKKLKKRKILLQPAYDLEYSQIPVPFEVLYQTRGRRKVIALNPKHYVKLDVEYSIIFTEGKEFLLAAKIFDLDNPDMEAMTYFHNFGSQANIFALWRAVNLLESTINFEKSDFVDAYTLAEPNASDDCVDLKMFMYKLGYKNNKNAIEEILQQPVSAYIINIFLRFSRNIFKELSYERVSREVLQGTLKMTSSLEDYFFPTKLSVIYRSGMLSKQVKIANLDQEVFIELDIASSKHFGIGLLAKIYEDIDARPTFMHFFIPKKDANFLALVKTSLILSEYSLFEDVDFARVYSFVNSTDPLKKSIPSEILEKVDLDVLERILNMKFIDHYVNIAIEHAGENVSFLATAIRDGLVKSLIWPRKSVVKFVNDNCLNSLIIVNGKKA